MTCDNDIQPVYSLKANTYALPIRLSLVNYDFESGFGEDCNPFKNNKQSAAFQTSFKGFSSNFKLFVALIDFFGRLSNFAKNYVSYLKKFCSHLSREITPVCQNREYINHLSGSVRSNRIYGIYIGCRL